MGIVNWVQSRFNGKTEKRRPNLGVAAHEGCQIVPEEKYHTDEQQWRRPQDGLLSIGTFGSDEPPPPEDHRASTTHDDMPELTTEEVKKLRHALAKLLRSARSKSGAGADSLPLDRFLTKARDMPISNGSNGGARIRHKSFKFLLKKMFVFVCAGGFAPAPSLKDPVESRLDKFFRAVLGKKINVRLSNATAARSYFLEDRPMGRTRGDRRRLEEEEEEKGGEDSCRWDRTDSEFIVLEI